MYIRLQALCDEISSPLRQLFVIASFNPVASYFNARMETSVGHVASPIQPSLALWNHLKYIGSHYYFLTSTGLGGLFAVGIEFVTFIIKRYNHDLYTSKMFSTAGRTVKFDLVTSAVVSNQHGHVCCGVKPVDGRGGDNCVEVVGLCWKGLRQDEGGSEEEV